MGRKNLFLDALKSRVLVGDGAMGTALHRRGVGIDACIEALNSTDRTVVREVHRAYVAAGAEVIETNTFRANRPHLARFDLGDKVFELNYRGTRMARAVAGRQVFVAGSVGPLSSPGPRKRGRPDAERVKIYAEQLNAIAAGGADLFLLETFTRIGDLRAAILAAEQAAPDVPVIAQMAFYEGHGSLGGVSVEQLVAEIVSEGVDGIGVNCGRGFADALATVEQIAALTDLPICAFPNAGLPELRDGRLVYDQPPQYMAQMAERMVDAGVHLVGGCCGTDEKAIAALSARLRGRIPVVRDAVPARPRIVVAEPPEVPEPVGPPPGSFLDRVGKEPLVVVELDPPRGMLTDKVIEGARLLGKAGAHLISMAENPLASIRMGNVGMAYLVLRDAGVEPLVHFTGRDRNTLGLHSDLMGAAALGIRHVLAVTGDPAGPRDSGVTSVYDVNSVGLVKILSALNRGRTIHGVETGRPAGFTVGVAFNPNFKTMRGQVLKLHEKVRAGAHFALTQLVYDTDRIARIREATDECAVPVLPGVMPMASLRNALFMKSEVPGVRVPEAVIDRMREHPKGADARKVGLEIGRELIAAALESGAPGIYLVSPFNRAAMAAELVEFTKSTWRGLT